MKLSHTLYVLFVCGMAGVLAGGCSRPSSRPSVEAIQSYCNFLEHQSPYSAVSDLSLPGSSLSSSVDPTGGNDDYSHFLRPGPKGWGVAADMQGPGVLTRFWFTGSYNGEHRIRFYFDNEKKPRIDTTVGEWCGGSRLMKAPVGAYEQYCWYNLLPIPFSSRLVVMIEEAGPKPDGGQEKIYYQLNWRKAAEGETLASFPGVVEDEKLAAAISAFAQRMDHQDVSPNSFEVGVTNALLAPGAVLSLPLPDGPHTITRLEITPKLMGSSSVRLQEELMRKLVLMASWDGQPASVQVPLGDFFGSPWARTRFSNAFFGLEGDRFHCSWPMEYAQSALWTVRNDAEQVVRIDISATLEPSDQNEAPSYFHAVWSRTGPSEVGKAHPILQARGHGRYVGCLLTVVSQDRSWWILEGDESIRTDGAATPQWLGTGLEDYFTGGWYYQGPLARPWHGLIMKAPFRTIQYRLHPFDAPAFNQRIDVQIERGPDNASRGWMESVAFYYADKPYPAPPLPGPGQRQAPVDPVAEATLYTELNGLGALGDTQGMLDKAKAFLEWKPTFPFKDTLALRALWMKSRHDGFSSVRDDVYALRTQTRERAAQEAAGHWVWFEKDPSRALLLFFVNMPARVYLDGQPVLQSDGTGQKIDMARITLSKGQHLLAVETAMRGYPDWMQCRLITHDGEVCSSPDWRASSLPENGWTELSFDDSHWSLVGGIGVKGPPEVPYVWVEPCVFPLAPALGLRLDGPKPPKARSVAYRTSFSWPM